MGSHPWKSVTAYEPDVAAALARAQLETFDRGEYGFAYKMKPMIDALVAAGKKPPPLPPEPKARSIEEAREIGAESGTCSVLDVYSLGDAPAPGVAGPLAESTTREAFGSEHPTLAEAEAGLGAVYESLDRGEAAYFVCYENGQSAHYVFMGMSFD
jgi:hypothetical protein